MLREALGAGLGVDNSVVDRLARTASHRYKTYDIPKRTGGTRTVHHPAKPLKAVQRWLQANIVELFPVHTAAAAYRPGRNIADHARMHVDKRYLLRLDLKDFFPSIDAGDLIAFLKDRLEYLPPGWTEADSELFTAFVCRFGELTVGAVTSPGVSNAICHELDGRVATAIGDQVVYTRYADDLFFSTDATNTLGDIPQLVRGVLAALPYPTSLGLNDDKTQHSSLKRRRRVTGMILTSDRRVSVGRPLKRRIRSLLHSYHRLEVDEKARLAGLLAFVRGVEPDFFNRLVLKYREITVTAAKVPSAS